MEFVANNLLLWLVACVIFTTLAISNQRWRMHGAERGPHNPSTKGVMALYLWIILTLGSFAALMVSTTVNVARLFASL